MKEVVWKKIVGYEGLYEVSNNGEIKSIARVRPHNNRPGLVKWKEKILKINTYPNGYMGAHLSSNGLAKTVSVHKIVALAFIPNPKSKPQVNHINGIKSDNRVENLEWVTASENTIHAFNTGLRKSIKGENNPLCKRIINKKSGEVYKGTEHAAKMLGVSVGAIRHWIYGHRYNKFNLQYL